MATADTELNEPEPGLTEPYVGLRPFERDEHAIFRGRDRDAQFFCDKVFAARLTLLYGGSGLGKSSLLRALIIPRFEEEEDAQVLYFDAWAGENPALDLKAALVERASELGIPDAGAGAPTIAELVRLIQSVNLRTFVLILDQFEEFLVNHAEDLDPLKRELGALVRDRNLDARTVLSLREEFLAALEPLREDILNLFASTYRLEPLDVEGTLAAIEHPAKLLGKSYEPELLQQLVRDLSVGRQDDVRPREGEGRAIDLPMLQLVCSRLWDAAKERGEDVLSVELYERRLGGYRQILEDYVRNVMPSSWSGRYRVARLMTPLAPASGLKISFSVEDLAQITEIKASRIETDLKRLSGARVLRTRQYRHSQRFEVQHDALIRVIAPWRDAVLRRARIRRRGLWGLATLALLAAFGAGIYQFQLRGELTRYLHTEGPLADLRQLPDAERNKLVEARLDNAAAYLLWRAEGPERLDDLKRLLEAHVDLMPEWYGVDRSGLGFVLPPGPGNEWPLTLSYSSRRALDEHLFTLMWRHQAKFYAELWGIPLPRRLKLVPDPALPSRLLRLSGPGMATFELEVPMHEDAAFVSSAGLSEPAMEFLERFRADWQEIEGLEYGGPYWVVPRWSLPVWKVSGHLAADGSGLPAYQLAVALQEKPEHLLGEPAVEFLLDRVAETHPETVAEVRAARGSRLPQDLAEIVKLERGLTSPHLVFDALANVPELPSPSAAAATDEAMGSSDVVLPPRLHGPWAPTSTSDGGDDQVDANSDEQREPFAGLYDAYREIVDWLPPPDDAIRIPAGADLVSYWTDGDDLSPEFNEVIEETRDEIWRQFGLEMPLVRLRTWDTAPLAPNAFRIELLDQTIDSENAQPIETTPDVALERLAQELDWRVRLLRQRWLSTELASRLLLDVDESTQNWLNQRYSLTDLKLIFRGVVAPTPSEQQAQPWIGDALPPNPPERSLRTPGWLLGSLVFWTGLEDPMDLPAIVERLHQTQRARATAPLLPAEDNAEVTELVRRGVEALQKHEMSDAERLFATAIAADPVAAELSFLATYGAAHTKAVEAALEEACAEPSAAFLSRDQQADIEFIIGRLDRSRSAASLRRYQLCLLGAYPAWKRPHARHRLIADLVAGHRTHPDGWSADDARYFGEVLVKDYEPTGTDASWVEAATALLLRAVVDLDAEQAAGLYREISSVCYEAAPREWCWELLGRLAEKRLSIDTEVPIFIALSLAERERAGDLRRALSLTDMAMAKLAAASPKPPYHDTLLSYAELARAAALSGLAAQGLEDRQGEAEALLRRLQTNERADVGQTAHIHLVELLYADDRVDEALQVAQSAAGLWPDAANIYAQKLTIHLSRNEPEAAAETVREVLSRVGETDDALFAAAVSNVLTGAGKWEETGRRFLGRSHPYVAYVAMMLYGTMAGEQQAEGRALLARRWSEVDRMTWPGRLAHGDPMVWREMLIGYYLGEVGREEIFGPLQSDEELASSALAALPFTRQGLLCEAHFYDAILQRSAGRMDETLAALQQAIATGRKNYYEYKMAKFLLARLGSESSR